MAGRRVWVSDCEGPISKNDNAFELAQYFIPNGDKLFTLISRYDDLLADVIKKPDYKAGDTLKLILPFLKAYGATNQTITEYSSRNVLLVPGAKDTLQFVKRRMPSFIVSTSYEQYLFSLCKLTGFPFENVYCTRLDLDKYKISTEEKMKLKKMAEEITKLKTFEIPENVQSINDLRLEDRKTVEKLDSIFWEKLPRMEVGKMLRDINPIGGYEKSNSVKDIIIKTGSNLADVLYVGDSITDVFSFRLVRNGGGLTISFNGNQYAVREAEIAVISNHTIIISLLADTFNRLGRDETLKLVREWSTQALKEYSPPNLYNEILTLFHMELPKVEIVTEQNRERLIRESSSFRKTVRGEIIGNLG
ncbi:MAG: hypothetical protein QXH91_08760 [Candidatus Bathyarchaeia archaeon]